MTEMLTEAELKEKALEAIKKVYDPEIPVNIYELGLVYEISVFPINNVFVQMTLTSPSCPAAQSIPEDVKRFIKEISGKNDTKSIY